MRRALASLLLALALAGAAPARAAEGTAFRLDFEAYLGGFRSLSAAAEGRYDARAYAIEVAARTRGVVAWFGDWVGRGVSRGAASGGALRPTGFRADTTWRGEPRFVELAYAPDGSVAVNAEPPPELDNRDPVPARETLDTVDALSAAMALIRSVNAAGRCAGETRVYDGRRRFDMRLSDDGEDAVPKSGYGVFAGAALKCRVALRRIGGIWKNVEHPEDGKPSFLWMARLAPGGPYLPVRIEAETPLGTLIMHLSAVGRPNGTN
ncbi:MAG: DUF3108 domain-containing protein [Rhodospirillales bacterium]